MTRKRGRPKKAGARFPSGQRKVLSKTTTVDGKPNELVVARRRVLLGNPDAKPHETRAAENPLDTMAARGWLDPSLARAGNAYAELCRQVGHHARKVTASLEEAPETSGVDARRIVDMTPEEIHAIWAVLERRGSHRAGADGDGAAQDTKRLYSLWIVLGPSLCAELNAVCINQSWPLWAMQMVCGRMAEEIPEKWMRKRSVLAEGLTIVREVLSPAKPKAQREQRDHPFLAVPKVEEVVEYVDEEGRPDPVTTRSGREVEVVRRRRA